MAEATKFTFNEMFGSDASVTGTPLVAHICKIRWTEEEIDSLKSEARTAGAEEALGSIATQTAQKNAAAGEQIAAAAAAALSSFEQIKTDIQTEAAKLSLSIAQKLTGALIDLHPREEIDAVIRECLTHLTQEPRLVIRVADTLATQVENSIQQAASERGMADKIMVVGDHTLQLGDCKVEWSDGELIRSREKLNTKSTEIIDRYIETLTGTTNKSTNEENTHV